MLHLKLTILHPFATNALNSCPLLGQWKRDFKLLPVIFGQKDTFKDSMARHCLLMAESPASVKTAQPLRSNDLKLRPAAEQICKINKKKKQIKLSNKAAKTESYFFQGSGG